MMLNLLFKQFGINKEDLLSQARDVQDAVLAVDANMRQIAERLGRIEAHLGIPEIETLRIENGQDNQS